MYDIVCDGINPSIGLINFSLSDLPTATDFTNLFQTYVIEEINISWRPEYTELTDAALVSNATNVAFNTGIQLSSTNAPASVNDVLQYQGVSTTQLTRQHRVRFKPMILMNGLMPCSCQITTDQATANWYGVAYGINATGIAMRFYSTCVFRLRLSGMR